MPGAAEFEAELSPHLPALARLVRSLVPTRQDAEDVLQEALLHALLGWDSVRRPDRRGAWLRTVAFNRAMQWQRRRYADARVLAQLASVPGGADTGDDADARVDAARALGLLTPQDRQVVVLRYAHGWTSDEIAALQGQIASTVRGRLRRLLSVLRAAAAQEGD